MFGAEHCELAGVLLSQLKKSGVSVWWLIGAYRGVCRVEQVKRRYECFSRRREDPSITAPRGITVWRIKITAAWSLAGADGAATVDQVAVS